MIGDCCITLQEVDRQQLPEIGYHVRRDNGGQGFATEARPGSAATTAWHS